MLDAAIIAAIVEAVGAVGSSAIAKKTDSPTDPSSILDWTYTGKNHQGRPSYNEGGVAYQFMSSHFKKPPAGVPEDRKVYDDNGRLLGWFAVGGPAKTGFEAKGFRTKQEARTQAKMSPYQMNRGTEGEMWLGQRENIFRQDLDFSKREAANKLSIRQGLQGDELAMRRRSDYFDAATSRGVAQFDQDTRHQGLEREWAWQQDTAAQEGAAYRARMQAQYPGASTWDLLSGGSASGAGPGAVPGLPGMPPPSMGTGRSGPDPSVAMAKVQADSQAMQTIAQAKIAGAQMRVQEGIAKRNALISFMNTAIEGAKTPAEIMARASAAKLATQQAETEKWKPGLLHQQAGAAASSAVLADAQAAKSNVEAENAAYGKQVEQFRRLADRGDISSVMEMFGLASPLIQKYFRRTGVRKHSGKSIEQEWKEMLDESMRRSPRRRR